MLCNVIATGSEGNAVVYNNIVMVDCGAPYSHLKHALKSIKVILLTHKHSDHFRARTIKAIKRDYPFIIWCCCEWLAQELIDIGVVPHVLEIGKKYTFGAFGACPVMLNHNVENCGYRLYFGQQKIFHATDTYSLDGIKAIGYDLYAIEFNHDEIQIEEDIKTKQLRNEFAYEIQSKKNHMSFQRAEQWLDLNNTNNSEVIKLHMSERYWED